MNNITVTSRNGVQYRRISKQRARLRYNTGSAVFICPCKVNPCNLWGIGTIIDPFNGYDFDSLINEYEFYNCGHNELGRYTAFYIVTLINESALRSGDV